MTIKTKFILNAFISSLLFSIVLFISAGRIDYLQGWAYLFTSITTTLMNVLTIKANPELMSERTNPGEGIKPWDKMLLGLSLLVFVATMILAGLDSGRYQWSTQVPLSVVALGIFFMISGQTIFLVARKENKFFSTVMRIQKERGHTVCESGIYSVIRHPGYLGMIISTIGIPLILCSLWSVIPIFVSIVLLCIRTILEDNTLKIELDGYTEYIKKTPYRLIPWIW
jgi:protein-S-isoprenylcysteine O-methyltransferase Ste14